MVDLDALEDVFSDAIGDSLEMDWQAGDGARAVMRTDEMQAILAELRTLRARLALLDAPETVEAVKDAANDATADVDEYCTTEMATAALAAVKTMMGEV